MGYEIPYAPSPTYMVATRARWSPTASTIVSISKTARYPYIPLYRGMVCSYSSGSINSLTFEWIPSQPTTTSALAEVPSSKYRCTPVGDSTSLISLFPKCAISGGTSPTKASKKSALRTVVCPDGKAFKFMRTCPDFGPEAQTTSNQVCLNRSYPGLSAWVVMSESYTWRI